MDFYIVRTEGLKKYYKLGNNTVKALDGVDFTVKEREFVAIIGRSGSGKSTLLHMIGGLDVPTAGEVYVDGRRLSDMNREQLTVFRRRRVGFVFQNYNLVPDLNVYENVVLPIELDGRKIDRDYVDEILEFLQLEDKKEALPGALSGGQQQRAAIARAVAARPAILLCDGKCAILRTAAVCRNDRETDPQPDPQADVYAWRRRSGGRSAPGRGGFRFPGGGDRVPGDIRQERIPEDQKGEDIPPHGPGAADQGQEAVDGHHGFPGSRHVGVPLPGDSAGKRRRQKLCVYQMWDDSRLYRR